MPSLRTLHRWVEPSVKFETFADPSTLLFRYRWVAYDSALQRDLGDAIIIGASRMEQLEESLKWFKKGPLPGPAVEKIQQVWDSIKQ